MPNVIIRPARADDADFLADMVVAAVNWSPSDAHWTRERVLATRELAHYVVGWPRPGDFGVVALADGERAGAAWFREFPADDPGYGFVRPGVPELTLAVTEPWRGRGVGRKLLHGLLAEARARGLSAVSLSVASGNRAARLYVQAGFRVVGACGDSDTMLLTWPDNAPGRGAGPD
ncbi:GNAT family N-acetyltransferase [Luedemannella helvata]|uniref:N-acetyltransferase domain-containing protein n=1 Tax=Luedemannella helvata TaxID=349315 RepID=A0ABP4WF94_9ACTN